MGERATPLELDGPDGPIAALLREAEGDRGVALVLPGFLRAGGRLGGSPGRPPLSFAVSMLRSLGLSVLEVWWEEPPADANWLASAADTALRRANTLDRPLEVLVGKSMGTWALAVTAAPPDVASVWLTPLVREPGVADAIARYGTRAFVVAGTADELFEEAVGARLRAAGAAVVVLEGADHTLETDDPVASARLLADWLQPLQAFLRAVLPAYPRPGVRT